MLEQGWKLQKYLFLNILLLIDFEGKHEVYFAVTMAKNIYVISIKFEALILYYRN